MKHGTKGAVLMGEQAKMFEVIENVVCSDQSKMPCSMVNGLERCFFPFRVRVCLDSFKGFSLSGLIEQVGLLDVHKIIPGMAWG